jgi:polysaccharide biosynthesis transport protein
MTQTVSQPANRSTNRRWDFDDLRAALYRARFPVAAIMALALLLGILAAWMTEPLFRATATVQIDQQAAKVLGTEDSDPSSAIQDADRFLQTQVDIIRGRDMALKVSKALKLDSDAEFEKALGLKSAAGSRSSSQRQDEILRAIDRHLDIDLPVDSRLIRIGFESRNAEISAKIANAFAEAYISANLARRQDTANTSRKLLATQLTEAESRLGEAERAVVVYARQNAIIRPVPGVNGEAGQSIVEGRLASLNQAYSNATARRIDAEQRWRSLSGAATGSLPEAINNPAYQDLINQRALAKAEYEDQTSRRRGDHPNVRQAAARMQELDRQLASFGGGVRGSVQAEYRTALAQENSIAAEIGRLKSASFNERDRSVQLGILEREAEKARSLYDMVLQRYNEVNAQSQGLLNNASLLGRATPAFRPVSAPTLLYVALALILGALLSAIYVGAREFGARLIRVPHDSNELGLPLIGTVPDIAGLDSVKKELATTGSRLADAALSNVAALGLLDGNDRGVILAVTSNDPADGKSSTAFALGAAAAAAGIKTLLVDFDLRDPSLATIAETTPRKVGAAEILAQQAPLADGINRDILPGLDALLAVRGIRNPAELLASGNIKKLFDRLRNDYAVVIVDCSPLLELADAIFVARAADKTVIIASADMSRMDRVRAGVQRLRQSGIVPAGLILNRFDASRLGYGKRYGQPDYGSPQRGLRFGTGGG